MLKQVIENLNESNSKGIAKKFISHINSMDFSYYDFDVYTRSGMEEYLDMVEYEDDDAKYALEDEVAPIDDIRDSLDDVEKALSNKSKISKIQAKIDKLQAELDKLL
jgi:hypothetical protein